MSTSNESFAGSVPESREARPPSDAPALRVLHESVVQAEEIDALGHMNVRYYGSRALASTERLLAWLESEVGGFGAPAPLVYDLPRLFTRYQREQHTGAPLIVQGGLLDVSEGGLRFYHELRNPERGELAASFVQDIALHIPGKAEPLAISEGVGSALSRYRIAFPKDGAPRSIDLDAAPVAPTLDDALASGLAFRLPRRVEAEDCDAEGRLSAETRPFYMWGGDPIPPVTRIDGPPLVTLADGEKMGWASMETRSVMLEQPVAGMRVQSFAATVELARKTNLRRYWIFDLDSGRLLLANEVVELALHLRQRRAIEIPKEIRAEMAATLRPDLR